MEDFGDSEIGERVRDDKNVGLYYIHRELAII